MHAPNQNATPIDLPEKVYGSGDAVRFLSDDEVADAVRTGLAPIAVDGRRVLLIVPDGTRTIYLNDVRRTLLVKQMETFNLSVVRLSV